VGLVRQVAEDAGGQAALVATGALSLCAQMWFQAEVSDTVRQQCGEVLLLLAGATLDEGKLKGQRMSTKLALAALSALGRWAAGPACAPGAGRCQAAVGLDKAALAAWAAWAAAA
jgi:hypothetical protein